MRDAAIGLGTRAGYSGYGAEQGRGDLREALQSAFYSNVGIKANEIFVSDGSKCDIGRLQMMFGADVSVAVQVFVCCGDEVSYRCMQNCMCVHSMLHQNLCD